MNVIVGETADLLMQIDQLETRLIKLYSELTIEKREKHQLIYLAKQLIELNQKVLERLTRDE